MKPTLPITLAAAAALLLAGCQTEPGMFLPQESTKYSIENTGKFFPADRATQLAVTCTGLQEHFDAEGKLGVVANIMNRENHPIEVQVRCVFKDASGFSTGDETPWQTLGLAEGATEAVRYTAANNLARKFTVTVRAVR